MFTATPKPLRKPTVATPAATRTPVVAKAAATPVKTPSSSASTTTSSSQLPVVAAPLAVRQVNAWPTHLTTPALSGNGVVVGKVDGGLALVATADARVAAWPVRADAPAPTAVLLSVTEDGDGDDDDDGEAENVRVACVAGAAGRAVLVAARQRVCLWPDALRAAHTRLRCDWPRALGRAAAIAWGLDERCCVVATDRGRLLLFDTADAFGAPALLLRRAEVPPPAEAANAGLLSSIGSLFSWGRATPARRDVAAADDEVRVGAPVVGLLPLDADHVLVWTAEQLHVWHPGRLAGSAPRLTLSADVAAAALPLLGATPDARLRLVDAALVDSDRAVFVAVCEPRDSAARPPDERSVRRLVLIDVAVDATRTAHSLGAAVVLPPDALPASGLGDVATADDDDAGVRLLAAGDGCCYVVHAGGALCVDVDLALVARHDAVQRHCVSLPPLAVVAAGVQAGERGPVLLVTRAHGAFACARSVAAPRDVQRVQRAAPPVAAAVPASLSLAEAIRATFDVVRSLAPSAVATAGERVLALVQRAGSASELGAACVAASAALLNAQPASHPHWAELGGADRLSSLLSNQLEQKQQLHDALLQFFATRFSGVRVCDSFDAASEAALARHSQAVRAARALRALQNETTTTLTALSEAIRATVAAWRANEADSDAWRAFGVHDHFFHSVLRVPEVLRQLARFAAQSELVQSDVSGVELRLCNDAFVVACRALSADALRAAHVSGAVRAHAELVAAFVERQLALQHEQRSHVSQAIAEQLAALAGAALGASDERTLLRDGGEAADADAPLDGAAFVALRARLLPLLQRDCAEQHRALAERFRDFEALAEICEQSADGEALLQRYMDAFRGDGFDGVVYRRYARLGGKQRALLLQQPEARREAAAAFVGVWPQMRWPDQVRYGKLGAAADSLLAAATEARGERERTRTLCSLARVAARAGNDRGGEARAEASLRVLRLGDVLLGLADADADGVGSVGASDFDDNDGDARAAESDELLLADDTAIVEQDSELLTARATFVAALLSNASRAARVLRAALALQCWQAGALTEQRGEALRADVDVARRRVWRAALSGGERWRRVAAAWANGQLSDTAVESAVRGSAAVQLARSAFCPLPLPTRDEALQLAFGAAIRDGDDEVPASAVRLFDTAWMLVSSSAQQHQ